MSPPFPSGFVLARPGTLRASTASQAGLVAPRDNFYFATHKGDAASLLLLGSETKSVPCDDEVKYAVKRDSRGNGNPGVQQVEVESGERLVLRLRLLGGVRPLAFACALSLVIINTCLPHNHSIRTQSMHKRFLWSLRWLCADDLLAIYRKNLPSRYTTRSSLSTLNDPRMKDLHMD